MGRFAEGENVFIPCPTPGDEAAFLEGVVTEVNQDQVQVTLTNGETVSVHPSEIRLRFIRDDKATSPDNTSMVHLNDATILRNLCERHKRDEIYTYTASVLLAVNPYKEIPGLYGEDQCERYKGKHIGALPPHPYAIADTAYRALIREQKNQGLLISGESGAGKTETAKIVMQYLAFASKACSNLATKIQDRVLGAQPILESFGNAATMRNNNSSRFGKYNRVFFNKEGTLVHAGITTYLLESSRVVVHGERERTYHCFYEMLHGLPEEKLASLGLERGRSYKLLCATRVNSGEGSLGVHAPPLGGFTNLDQRNFKRLVSALQTVGLDEGAIDAVWRTLAGLIHLGDLPRAAADGPGMAADDPTPHPSAAGTAAAAAALAAVQFDDNADVELDEESLQNAARLLGMDPDELGQSLRFKTVSVPGRRSFHKVPRTVAQFRQALHSLIKALYKRLFEYIVQRINDSFRELCPQGFKQAVESDCTFQHIGILDIYGFERLERNSFEQLCINLANERLQHYFVENVLAAEQTLYSREGLPWVGLALPDSGPVVSCIGQVFKTLDEFSQLLAKNMPGGNDEQFCTRAVEDAQKDSGKILQKLKFSNKTGRLSRANTGLLTDGFSIKHYAGHVEYHTKGWLDKNNDRLLAECEGLICDSTNQFVKSLGEDDKGKVPFRSISKKYSSDLEALLQTLSSCHLQYIRCFKPNERQKPNMFQHKLVLDQIVQCGTIELVKIMHDGFPNRCCFEEITTRFRDLLPERFQRYGMRTFIEALMLAYEVPHTEWAVGLSKLFLKAGQLKALEAMRSEGTRPNEQKLAEIVHGIIRKRWARAGHAVRLVNYLPAFLEGIKLRRRQRARRRLAGFFRAVHSCTKVWLQISKVREQRKDRLATMMWRAFDVQKRLRAWLKKGRARLEAKKEEAARQKELKAAQERAAKEAVAAAVVVAEEAPAIKEPTFLTSAIRSPMPVPLKEAKPAPEAPLPQAGITVATLLPSVDGSALTPVQLAQMEQMIQALQQQMDKKQSEVEKKLQDLELKNHDLESQLKESAREKRLRHLLQSPARQDDDSCSSPDQTPPSSRRIAFPSDRRSLISQASLGGSGRMSHSSRHSVAEAAYQHQHGDKEGNNRQWWQEQRSYLLEDLYGSPGTPRLQRRDLQSARQSLTLDSGVGRKLRTSVTHRPPVIPEPEPEQGVSGMTQQNLNSRFEEVDSPANIRSRRHEDTGLRRPKVYPHAYGRSGH